MIEDLQKLEDECNQLQDELCKRAGTLNRPRIELATLKLAKQFQGVAGAVPPAT